MATEFICIAEAGVLEQQSLLLCESIRTFGGRYADAPIAILEPRRDRRISAAGRRELNALRADVMEMSITSPCPEYGTSLRVMACAAYEPFARADCLVWMDSDAVILAEPDFALQDRDVAARPVDVKGMCTSGEGDARDSYWRELCRLCGVDYDSIPQVTTTVDRVTVKASYNGGLTVVGRDCGLFARTEDFFVRSVRAALLPWPDWATSFPAGHGTVGVDGGRFWGSAQACLSLAITALGLSVRILPPSQNFPLHSYPELLAHIECGTTPTICHAHYHHVFRSDPRDNPILSGQPGFPAASMRWLSERREKLA